MTNVKLVIRELAKSRRTVRSGKRPGPSGQSVIDARTAAVDLQPSENRGSTNRFGRHAREAAETIDPQLRRDRRLGRFSPDGSQIALGPSRDGDFEIYVMQADGARPRRLTESAGMDMRSAWSPDGRQIAFTSMGDGNYENYANGADGSAHPAGNESSERDDFAQWHPDGKCLLHITGRHGGFDLYLMDVD